MSTQNTIPTSYRLSGLIIMLTVLTTSCKETTELPTDSSAYITEVFEYVYAPGQHATLAKAKDAANFIGEPTSDKGFLYLGGFGGYVVAGFNHDVVNSEGADFEVYALPGASPEPAVVYVMQDTNGDGKPNDTWYELKGNQFNNSRRNYRVCYYKAVNDSANVTWKDSEGGKGELVEGIGTKSSAGWWWSATTNDSISFTGTRLPDAYINFPTTGNPQNWKVPTGRFTFGYAENQDGTDFDTALKSNKLDISNAVDAQGDYVALPNIRFIKVQTSVLQQVGWLNEVSSEVRGAKDLRY